MKLPEPKRFLGLLLALGLALPARPAWALREPQEDTARWAIETILSGLEEKIEGLIRTFAAGMAKDQERAREEIRQIGPAAVPILLQALAVRPTRTEPRWTRPRGAAAALGALASDLPPQERQQAIAALRRILSIQEIQGILRIDRRLQGHPHTWLTWVLPAVAEALYQLDPKAGREAVAELTRATAQETGIIGAVVDTALKEVGAHLAGLEEWGDLEEESRSSSVPQPTERETLGAYLVRFTEWARIQPTSVVRVQFQPPSRQSGRPELEIPQATLQDKVGRAFVQSLLARAIQDRPDPDLDAPALDWIWNVEPARGGAEWMVLIRRKVSPSPAAGLEEIERLDRDAFLQRFPDQARQAAAHPQANRFLVAPAGTPLFLYRPETLATGLEELVETQKEALPAALDLRREPIPSAPDQARHPLVFLWDRALGQMAYAPNAPVVAMWNGDPIPYALPQLIAIGLSGSLDAGTVQLVTVWRFERGGRSHVVFAVQT